MIGQPQKASEFNGGLITDRDAALLAPNQSPSITNADMRFRAGLRKLPGSADWKDGLPSGFTPYCVTEILFTKPSTQQVTVLYGTVSTDSSQPARNHRIFIRPYINFSGSWIDDWQDLSEHEGGAASSDWLTVQAGSTTNSIKLTGLAETSTDYYKGWIFVDHTQSETAIVTGSSHSAGTWTLSLNKALSTDPTSTPDKCMITRNCIYDFEVGWLFYPSNNNVEFLELKNSFIVLSESESTTQNLWCGYINYAAYQDSDLDWQGIYLDRNDLRPVNRQSIATLTDTLENDDPVPDGTYLIWLVATYDGFQEGPINGGSIIENGYQVGKGYASNIVTTSGDKIQVDIQDPQRRKGPGAGNGTILTIPNPSGTANLPSGLITSKRVTSWRVYIAEAELGGSGYYQPIEEWRFIREIGIDESGWSYSSGNKRYEYATFDILGSDYQDAALADLPSGIDLEGRQGHTDLQVFGHAKTAAVSANRVFYANTYLDEQRESFFLSTPINSDGLNTPSVMPWTSFSYDTNVNGISQIIKIVNVLNRVIVLGKTDLLRVDPNIANAGFSVADQYRDIGGLSSIGVCVVGGILYFASDKGIMAYLPNASQVIDTSVLSDISEGAVQNAWRDLGVSVREATAIGWCKVHNYLVLSNSSGTWAFHLGDKNWTYYGSTQYIQFAPGIDGELIGVTSAGAVKELFADTPDESTSLTYYSPVFYGPMLVTGFRAKYKSDVALTVSIIDKSNDRTLKSLTLPASSSYHTYRTDKFNVKVDLLQYAITSAAATTNDLDILSLEPFITPLSVQPL